MSNRPLVRILLASIVLIAPAAFADDSSPADQEAAVNERIERWVSNLASPSLELRREATLGLRAAGPSALPFLEAGAADNQQERAVVCFELIQRLVNSEHEETKTRALEVVQRLAESGNEGAASRAESILAAKKLTDERIVIAMLEGAGCRIRRGRSGEVTSVSGISSDRQLAVLKSLSFGGISRISMSGAGITDDGLQHLSEVAAIRSLSIAHSAITDNGLKTLSELENVNSLSIGPGNYTSDGLRVLGTSGNSGSLALRGIAPEHLPVLSEMPRLRSLSLDNVLFSETEVGLLNDLDGVMMSLDLQSATDEDLQRVGQLEKLRTLTIFSGDGLTNDGIAHLSGLSLTGLTLNSQQLTDAALEHVGKIQSLQTLLLMGGQITDSGLQHLKGLTNLRILALNRTEVTEAGRQGLQEALPNLRLIGDRQAPPVAVRAPGVAPRPPVRPPELERREQELNQKLAEILNEDELAALNQLTRREQLRSEVGVTVDEDDGLVNLHFRRNLRAEDTEIL